MLGKKHKSIAKDAEEVQRDFRAFTGKLQTKLDDNACTTMSPMLGKKWELEAKKAEVLIALRHLYGEHCQSYGAMLNVYENPQTVVAKMMIPKGALILVPATNRIECGRCPPGAVHVGPHPLMQDGPNGVRDDFYLVPTARAGRDDCKQDAFLSPYWWIVDVHDKKFNLEVTTIAVSSPPLVNIEIQCLRNTKDISEGEALVVFKPRAGKRSAAAAGI